MKRFVVLFGVMALAAMVSNAEAAKGYAGVKGGVNMAELSGDGVDDLDMRNGFMGGGFYGFEFADGFDLRFEGLFVQKGAEGEYVFPGDDHGHESKINLDYIEVPVLVVANFGSGEKLGFNLFAGPTFGFNMTAEVEDMDHGETLDLPAEDFEFGAALGGGIEYMLSSFSIVLDARYSLGATNIVDADGADAKNRGIGVMAGVKFSLGAE
jgi:opacity protein-like surface antigen